MNESELIFKVKIATKCGEHTAQTKWREKRQFQKSEKKKERKNTTLKLNKFQLTSLEKIQFHHFIVEL